MSHDNVNNQAYMADFMSAGDDFSSNFAIYRRLDTQSDIFSLIETKAHTPDPNLSLTTNLHQRLANRIYKFDAERLNVTEMSKRAKRNLESNASNLPEVLHFLHNNNRSRYSVFENYVNIVFPHIKAVTTPPISDTHVRIMIWSISIDTQRPDLAIPLEHSGIGIGQVLAMLYVVVDSDFSRTIIIDEPQSFLHPGAVRKLFDIFRKYPQHQYIITTHSPTAVMSANPETITMIQRENMVSTVQSIDAKKNSELQLYLAEVGARLSDVFGADNILWVEGATEEQCFPKILAHFGYALFGTKIVGVLHTGDFAGKHKEMVLRIYNKLSQARGILPSAVGFVFDNEGRSDTDIGDMIREGKGMIHFLPRRLYENYLIYPPAICHVMNSLEDFKASIIEVDDISDWIEKHKWDKKYYRRQPTDNQKQNPNFYLQRIHGANFLHDKFQHFADEAFSYKSRKLEHAIKLTDWILENDEGYLQEINELLVKIIGR